ncbi:MAG: LpqN/LpqT family lipoprotein [Mycobacterium sp.]|nr:LpqN/LpqT family lipoprotein [Mycobacterium sp.]
MKRNARKWRVAIGGVAAGTAAVIGFAGASASAEPVAPVQPAPATVTQTVTVMPEANTAVAGPTATGTAVAGPTPAPLPTQNATAVAVPTAAAPTETLVPATSGTLTEFFKDKGVAMEPQQATGFTALSIVLPMPPGWSVVPDPNVPDAFQVLADRQGGDGLYTSNAQLVVYKLVGDFDPKEAIAHGYVDSEKLANWQTTNASLADFGGFPSSVIEGTYRENDMTLNTARRHVIATSGSDRYLVSLSITTAANQVVASAAATDAIAKGFRVAVPGTPAAPAASPAEPTAAVAAAPATEAAGTAAAAAPAPAVPVVDPAQQH